VGFRGALYREMKLSELKSELEGKFREHDEVSNSVGKAESYRSNG
jgi:hypothetical protein